jgi:hypothetical protein
LITHEKMLETRVVQLVTYPPQQLKTHWDNEDEDKEMKREEIESQPMNLKHISPALKLMHPTR